MSIQDVKPSIFVVSGPSGSGKTTLCEMLIQRFPMITLSISCTTRPARGQEVHGKDYFFLTQEEFKAKIDQQGFLEWAVVYDHYYGTSWDFLHECRAVAKPVLLNIDVQGACHIKKVFPKESRTFFIEPPSLDALRLRLVQRATDHQNVVEKRLEKAYEEILQKKNFDHVVVNDHLLVAFENLVSYIKSYLGL